MEGNYLKYGKMFGIRGLSYWHYGSKHAKSKTNFRFMYFNLSEKGETEEEEMVNFGGK